VHIFLPRHTIFKPFSIYYCNKVYYMDIRKMIQGMFVMTMLLGLVAAGTGADTGADTGTAATQIEAGLCELYKLVNQVLAVVVFVLIVVAAIVYAGGQIMGAETRARASVWATSMIIGALIGVLIIVILPMIMEAMMPPNVTQDFASLCVQQP
jgi:hypothetical protein